MSWVLVTGGARGLGAEICLTLASRGYSVLVHYQTSNPQPVLEGCQARGVEAEAIQGGLSNPQGVQHLLDQCRGYAIRGLVNNVGCYQPGSLAEAIHEEWGTLFQTNLFAPAELCRALGPSLQSIVNIGVAGMNSLRVNRRAPLYSLTKLGLLGLTRALAVELAPSGVRVNMVSPGQLEGSVDLAPHGDLDPHKLPMKRAGTFQEVAEIVADLMAPDRSYITGQNIEVAGGYAL